MRRRCLLAALPLALSGCGFALRRAPALPFERIALTGFAPRSPLADELTRTLATTVSVVDAGQKPEVLLQSLTDRREKVVAAANAAGQVREVQLRVHFEFKLVTPGGRDLLSKVGLVLVRDLSYNETFALAKEQEEAQIYAAMQSDIVMQVLRRLAQAPRA